MDVPVQFFQSVIAIELAITGGLLYQIGFFTSHREDVKPTLPYHPRLRILMALVLSATVFGSLLAIRHQGQQLAAVLVSVGLAVSLLPILLWALPPLARDARSHSGQRSWLGIAGLVGYLMIVAAVVTVLVV